METSLPKDPGTDPESPARTSAAAGFRGLAQRLVYRARRWGGLTIVAMFRGLLGAADLLHLGARRRRRAPVAWPADRPLVSVLVAPDASLGEQTITGLQQVSGELPDALTQAQGKYLAVVPTGCTCDPSLLEKALLMLEAGPELGFVCAFPGGDAAPLDTQEILARAHRDPEQVAAMILRPALTDVAVPRATNVPALLQLVHEAVWEGVVLREPLVQIPRGDREDAVVPGAAATVAAAQQRRHPFLRLLPEALGVGLREAWRDHVRASRGGAAQNLVDYGRDLRTRAPDRRVVLWLVPWLRAGGVEAVLRNLLEGLGTDYHFVLCPTIDIDHDWRDRFTELGSEVYVLPELLPRRSWPAFLERLIQAKRPQVLVNTHSQYGYDVAAWLRRRLPGLRAYDLLHNDSELGFIRHAAKHDASYDGHVVVSDRIGTTLVEQYGVDPARVHTIANGIDVNGRFDPERYPPRAGAGDPNGDFVVGYVGRLAEEKDPLLFVDTAKALVGRGEPCRFIIAGDGPLAEKVRDRIAVHGLGNRLKLLGHVDEIPALLATLDICVLTSRVEGCPLVALEAMAMGRPVVSTAAGNLAEVLAPPLGRAVPGHSAQELAAAVAAELRSSRQPQRRSAIRAKIVQAYGLNAMAAAYAALFADGAGGLRTESPSASATVTAR